MIPGNHGRGALLPRRSESLGIDHPAIPGIRAGKQAAAEDKVKAFLVIDRSGNLWNFSPQFPRNLRLYDLTRAAGPNGNNLRFSAIELQVREKLIPSMNRRGLYQSIRKCRAGVSFAEFRLQGA